MLFEDMLYAPEQLLSLNMRISDPKSGFTIKLFFPWYCIWSMIISIQKARIIWADPNQKEKIVGEDLCIC